MRRTSLAAFATVSLTALLAVSAWPAAAKTLGALAQKNTWQVGTVEAKNAPYCAMVSRYDRDSVLAFARNPDGYGSLAIEFSDAHFKAGKDYDVHLALDKQAARTFTGHATNARSVVLQIGADSGFYDSFGKGNTLHVRTDAVEADFKLKDFNKGYKNLVDCAVALGGPAAQDPDAPQMAAVKVPDVEVEGSRVSEAAAQTVVETAAKAEAQADAAVATAEAKSASPFAALRNFFGGKKSGTTAAVATTAAAGTAVAATQAFDDVETAVARETAPQTAAAESNIQWFSEQKETLAADIDAQKREMAKLETEKKTVERKLLGTVKSASPSGEALATGSTARDMERMYVSTAENAGKEIAVLKAMRQEEEQKQRAESLRRQQALETEAAALQKQRDSLQAAAATDTADRARKASVIQKQAQIADINRTRAEEAASLDKKLAAVDADYATRIAALEKQLKESEAARQTAALRLDDAEKQNRVLQAALDAAQRGGAVALDSKAGAATADIALQQKHARVEQELQQRQADLQQLQARLSEVEAARVAETKRFRQLLDERDEAVRQVSALKDSLTAERQRYAALEKERAAAGDASALRRAQDEIARLRRDNSQLEQQLAGLRADGNTVAARAPLVVPNAADVVAIAPASGRADAPVSAAANRAEAFLEGIMKHHRPVNTPVAASRRKAEAARVTAVTPAPAMAAPVSPPPARPALEVVAAPLQEKPLLVEEPKKVINATTSVERLLELAGIRNAAFYPVEETSEGLLRQWALDKVNGMYEQLPVIGDAPFDKLAWAYLQRYHEDCPGKLNVKMEPPVSGAGGQVMNGELSCAQSGNLYNTSFAFIRNDEGFAALLHSAQPAEGARVATLGRQVAQALTASTGIAPLQSTVAGSHAIDVPRRAAASAAVRPASSGAALDTVVIE